MWALPPSKRQSPMSRFEQRTARTMDSIHTPPADCNSPTPRPVPLLVNPDGIPAELQAVPHWLVWRYVWKPAKGNGKAKWDKPPFDAKTAKPASSTDPATWATFAAALAAYRRGGWDGIGFVVHKGDEHDDGLVVFDLDKCRDAQTGQVEPWAQEHLDALPTYAEVSPSGTGVRLIGRGRKPPGRCRKGPFEVYETGRYVTITGQRLDGASETVAECQEAIDRVHAGVFSSQQKPKPAANGALPDDGELIQKARAAKNGAKFSRLWAGDTSGYASASEADAALCSILAYWTQGDRERIDSLFRQSALYRDKWERDDYRKDTLDLVLEGRTEFYQPGPKRQKPAAGNGHKEGALPPPPDDGEDKGNTPWPPPAVLALRQWLHERYAFTFRRGRLLYSAALGREVSASEITGTPTSDVLALLAEQSDAPRLRGGNAVDAQLLPYHYRTWLPVAWGDLAAGLPEEADAAEVVEPAAEEFRGRLSAALLAMVALTYHYDRSESDRTEVQRRPVVEWARLFARPGRWESVRGYRIWSRRDGETVRIAIRAELLGQLHARDLAGLSQRRLSDLCVLYGLGRPCHVAGGGRRATELSPNYLADLLAGPADPDTQTQDEQTHARVREAAS